jgi:predicted transcriptional regulator
MPLQPGEYPEEVLRFIERRIASVPHLEALLLLWENPGVSWADTDVATRVYIGREHAQIVLQELAQSGLIAATGDSPGRYSYNPEWDEEQLMEKVATTYRRHLVHVASLIHAKAGSKAVRDFARAFQMKREE